MGDTGHRFFTLNPRRKTWNLLLEPGLQLRLPLAVLGVTVILLGLLAAHTHDVFGRLLTLAMRDSSQGEYLEQVFQAQVGDFLAVWGALAVAYVLIVLGLGIVTQHRMVGPTIAFRRHIEALKNGDYDSRITLRRSDAFREVADDLNELAATLAEAGKPEPSAVDAVEDPATHG